MGPRWPIFISVRSLKSKLHSFQKNITTIESIRMRRLPNGILNVFISVVEIATGGTVLLPVAGRLSERSIQYPDNNLVFFPYTDFHLLGRRDYSFSGDIGCTTRSSTLFLISSRCQCEIIHYLSISCCMSGSSTSIFLFFLCFTEQFCAPELLAIILSASGKFLIFSRVPNCRNVFPELSENQ